MKNPRYFLVWFNVSVVCSDQRLTSKENRNMLLVTVGNGRFLNQKSLNCALKEKADSTLTEMISDKDQFDTEIRITGILEVSESDYQDWIAEDNRDFSFTN